MIFQAIADKNITIIQRTVCYHAVFWFLFFITSSPLSGHAEAQSERLPSPQDPDTVLTILPDIEVKASGHSMFRKKEDGALSIKSEDIVRGARVLGEIDFINQLKQLPGITTGSDYSSGLNIDGSDGSQAQYLINGAPVIFPYRFGGIFSTFNTPHFDNMVFTRQSASLLPPVVGASFEFTPALRFRNGLEGEGNIGITASSLTILAGVDERFSIGISGRVSYIDQLYGSLLRKKNSHPEFSFYDLNADFGFRISDKDCIRFSFFHSQDNVKYRDRNYSMTTVLKWNNSLFNLLYARSGESDIETNLYYSAFNNSLGIEIPQFSLTGPSAVRSLGYNLKIGRKITSGALSEWKMGLYAAYDHIIPQWAIMQMLNEIGDDSRSSSELPQDAFTALISGKIGFRLFPSRLIMALESSIGLYSSLTYNSGLPLHSNAKDYYSRFVVTPRISFQYMLPAGSLRLDCGWLQQPFHKVGFSDLGLSSDFRIEACHRAPVQQTLSISFGFSQRLPWLGFEINGGSYWKKLRNQAEYRGNVLEVIDTRYDPFSHLLISDGYNYGFYIAICRPFGLVTGELSYSYGDGRRHLHGSVSDKWKALNGDGHTLNASAVWHEGNHWEVSLSLLIQSGRRYTPVKALYALGGNIAMEYGALNSARLPSWQRLDIGGSYYFITGSRYKLRHTVNLSILNAYGHKNVEMQYFILNADTGDYTLKKVYSLYRFLPSLSYSIEF
ncbi:MAG: hypothetical protein K2J15_07065 [Muribaculaceae bacterium]|nr:hypothetical protein [Muribaculaceae bacterium]